MNCIPVFIAREPYWQKRFKKAGLPIIGDDIKSQVGATIVHRTLARLFRERGVRLERTSQLNVGGNMDFYNMLERERLESKKISKTNAVTSMLDYELPADDVYIGPSDYVPWLEDRKWAHIRIEGESFGGVPLNMELKLEVWDSPNSAGIVIDAVRLCKLALNNGIGGALDGPELLPDEVAARAGAGPGRARPHRGVHRRARAQEGRPSARSRRRRRSRASRQSQRSPQSRRAATADGDILRVTVARPDWPLAIAQVTPYPWEARREVNEYVERALATGSPRAVTACWCWRQAARARWCASRGG